MKHKAIKLLSILLCAVMLFSLFPLSAYAGYEDGVECEYCGSWRYDEWLCPYGDHCAAGYGCGDDHHCQYCGVCEDACEWCENCLSCVDCAKEYGDHCWECGACGVDEMLCDQCGRCYDCGGECSEGTEHLCLECHLDEDMACPDCGQCFAVDTAVRCIICGSCGACDPDYCEDCGMCLDCAKDNKCHCIECGVCQVDELLCEQCGRCYDCGGECSEGTSHLCLQCHLDEDMACPNCGKCYAVGDDSAQCKVCGACADCVGNYCEDCQMCEDCGIEAGTHCPDCGTCTKEEGCLICHRCFDCGGQCNSGCDDACLQCHLDNDAACPDCFNCFIEGGYEQCPECGRCEECGGGWCDNCGMCLDCAIDNELHCPGCLDCLEDVEAYCDSCHYCSSCADICPDCGEKCSECSVLCTNCGVCEDCTDICPLCGDYCSHCSDTCGDCGACEYCVDICPECGNACSDCSNICDDCGLCEDCCHDVSEAAGCEHGICVMSSEWDSHWEAEHAGQEHTHVYPGSYSTDADEHWKACKVCGEEEDRGAHRDHLTHFAAKEATCSEDGNTEYYVCVCGLWFEDEAATTLISDHDSVVITAKGHKVPEMIEVLDYKAPTCTEPGNRRCYECPDCGKWFFLYANRFFEIEDPEWITLPALGHDWSEWIETKPATTAEEGEETRTCSRCGEKETRSIAKLGVTSYTVTVNEGPNGYAIASASTAEEGAAITITAVPDSGYTVEHITWTTAGDYEYDITDTGSFIMPAGDAVIDVSFKEATMYNVFMAAGANGDAISSATKAAEGDKITITAIPKSGYVVDAILLIPQSGYETDITETSSFTMPACDVTIDVSFKEAVTYTVTFETNGGSAVATQTVEEGKTVTEPADPTKEGFIFDGWYQDATFAAAFDFSTPITADVTIYAKWKEESEPPIEITYTVVSGGNSTWTKGSSETVTITVKRSEADDTCFSHFTGVEIDGTALATGDYEAKAGSTVITIKTSTLDKLGIGEHTVTVNFDDGKAETKMTVAASPGPADPDVPQTGDNSHVGLWIGLMAVSILGLISVVTFGRKRRYAPKH